MSHRTSSKFRKLRDELPPEIRQLAQKNFELLKRDPTHPSLHFKKIGEYYSARVGLNYRAVGVDRPYGILWFWIGPHDEYTRLFG